MEMPIPGDLLCGVGQVLIRCRSRTTSPPPNVITLWLRFSKVSLSKPSSRTVTTCIHLLELSQDRMPLYGYM